LNRLVGGLSGRCRLLVGSSSPIHRVTGVLIGGSGALLGRANAALRALVNLFHLVASLLNLTGVLGCLLAYLIYFRLNRSGGVADVFFRSAATGEQGARYDARGRKESAEGIYMLSRFSFSSGEPDKIRSLSSQ